MNFAWMKCRATASSGWPSFSYMARKNSGSMRKIMPMTARLVLPERFIRKNAGTPMSAAAPKHTSCRFVRPKKTLVFTRVRSRGMEIYAANGRPPLLMGVQHTPGEAACLEQGEAQKHRVPHDAP